MNEEEFECIITRHKETGCFGLMRPEYFDSTNEIQDHLLEIVKRFKVNSTEQAWEIYGAFKRNHEE